MANEEFDVRQLTEALRALSAAMPKDLSKPIDPGLSHQKLKALLQSIVGATSHLGLLAVALDPIQRPPFVFDPFNPKFVGTLVGRTLREQPRRSFAELLPFYGSGVYAIYYNGPFPAYRPIAKSETPIYVGKADPPTPDAKTLLDQGPRLYGRLQEHARSIGRAPTTLDLADFDCRFVVVQSGWQKSAEDYLLNFFHPIWNATICYGFGKHGDNAATRSNTRSPWDTLHAGRPWATHAGNVSNPLSPEDIMGQIAVHFQKFPPNP